MTAPPRQQSRAREALLADYAVQPGTADELFQPDGSLRPVWSSLIDHLAWLSPDEIAERFGRGDQHLRDAGVFYRRYSADPQQERDWPLSHVPVVLDEAEWQGICDGLAQRADLLERVVADLYGAADLVRDGHLPPELVARNPEWHRPLVGVAPRSGHFLHLLAFEIGRGPDGTWLVLGDRGQAPSGAGFALENRRATARIFPDPFLRTRVRRLAGFFRAFRDGLNALPGAGAGGPAILSPGPGNDTYFEHTYIARYLGLALLEGEDLIVEDSGVHVRTVSGLQPVSVLWRRLDAAYADPLELDEQSQIGTPGLVDALRRGQVNLVNALGSGVLETRALMAFLPKIAEHLLGEPLRMPNLATWWCGQASEREYVKANADSMFIGEALSRALPFDIGADAAIGGLLRDPRDGRSLGDWIDQNGPGLVGQEAVTLSTTPVWSEGRLVPRPMSVRVFAARGPEGWTFLPGGYARIGRSGDPTALSMQKGGSVADVWVMGKATTEAETLMDAGSLHTAATGALPSRAADNLYWLGRYIERTEGAIRLLRAYHLRLAETGDAEEPLMRHAADLLAARALDVSVPPATALEPVLAAARLSAGRVRDRFSVDGWAALADLINALTQEPDRGVSGDAAARTLGVLLRKITGFNGLVHENMHRSSGWRFLTFGRAIERADGAAAVLMSCIADDVVPGLPDLALEYADSQVTHQRRYRVDPTRDTICDLIALDGRNPRAILFQLGVLREIAEDLPNAQVKGQLSPVLRAVLPLETRLRVAGPSDMSPEVLQEVRTALADISRRLSAAYLS